jgi:hypothetical protein
MAKIINDSILAPDVVEVAPLYEINSTAYAVSVEFSLSDSAHKATHISIRTDGDPVPTNMTDILSGLRVSDLEPHFSMQWINKKTQNPGPGRGVAIQDNIEEIVL